MKRIFRQTIALATALSLLPVWPVLAANDSTASKDTPQADYASLDNMLVGPDQIQIHLTRPAKYNTFTTANPPRIVLEILGAQINVSPRTMAGQGSNLKRIRAGQFQGEPEPICRVVLDLKQLTQYTVTPDDNMIVVKLESVAPTAAAPAAPVVAAAPAEAPAAPIAAAAYQPAPAVTSAAIPTAPAAASNPTPVPVVAPVPVRPTPAPVAAPVIPSAVAQDISTKSLSRPIASNDMNTIATQKSVSMGTRDAPNPVPMAPTYYPGSFPIALKPTAHDIIGNLPKDTVSLDLEDTEIGDVLKLLATKANTNIIYGPDVAGAVSLHLNNVPFSEAFSVVLGMKNLVVYQAGDNTLRVVTSKQLQFERTNTVGITQVYKVYYQDAADIKRELDSVRSAEKRTGQSVLDIKDNSIVLTDSPDGLAAAERLISQLDVRPQQVMIETKLVEVNLSKDLELGVQWSYFSLEPAVIGGQTGTNFIGGNPTLASGTGFTNPLNQQQLTVPAPVPVGSIGQGTGVSLPADKIFGAFSFGRVTNNYLLNATLTAAATKGKAKVLSDPKVATVNGKQATINITTQLPYATTNTAATGAATTTINYTTTGIQLTVTPTINADGRITLHLVPNISQPSATVATGGAAAAGAISIDTRQADTNIVVRDGETIVIGGIITDSISDSEAKIPFFGDIPVLGWLFKKKTISRQRVELLIFVTTKLLAD